MRWQNGTSSRHCNDASPRPGNSPVMTTRVDGTATYHVRAQVRATPAQHAWELWGVSDGEAGVPDSASLTRVFFPWPNVCMLNW